MISEEQTVAGAGATNARGASDSSSPEATRHSGQRLYPHLKSHPGERPSSVLVIAAFLVIYLIWGSTYLGIRYAIQTLPPFLMAGSRFLLAGAMLTLWARISGAPGLRGAQLRAPCVVGALLFLGGNGGVVWAEQYVTSGVAALLVATEPLWIVLLNWMRPGGQRPGAGVAVGLLVGFAGVWLLVESNTSAAGPTGGRELLAAVVVMCASVSWAVGSLYAARAPLPASPLLSAGIQMLAGGSLLAAAGILSGEWQTFNPASVSATSAGAFLYLLVCGSVIAFTAYSWLLRVVTPTRAATYAYVNPLVAVLLGWALAGEELTTRTLVAAGVITASVVIIVTRNPPGKTAD